MFRLIFRLGLAYHHPWPDFSKQIGDFSPMRSWHDLRYNFLRENIHHALSPSTQQVGNSKEPFPYFQPRQIFPPAFCPWNTPCSCSHVWFLSPAFKLFSLDFLLHSASYLIPVLIKSCDQINLSSCLHPVHPQMETLLNANTRSILRGIRVQCGW